MPETVGGWFLALVMGWAIWNIPLLIGFFIFIGVRTSIQKAKEFIKWLNNIENRITELEKGK